MMHCSQISTRMRKNAYAYKNTDWLHVTSQAADVCGWCLIDMFT